MQKVGLNNINSNYKLTTNEPKTEKPLSSNGKKDNSKQLKTALTCLAAAGIALAAGVTVYKFRGKILPKFKKSPQVDPKTAQNSAQTFAGRANTASSAQTKIAPEAPKKAPAETPKKAPVEAPKTPKTQALQAPDIKENKALPEVSQSAKTTAPQGAATNAPKGAKPETPQGTQPKTPKNTQEAPQQPVSKATQQPEPKIGQENKTAAPQGTAAQASQEVSQETAAQASKPTPQAAAAPQNPKTKPAEQTQTPPEPLHTNAQQQTAKQQDPAKILRSYNKDNEEAFAKTLSTLDDDTLQKVNEACSYGEFEKKDCIRFELEKRQCLKLYGIDVTKQIPAPRQDAVKSHHDLCGVNARVRERSKKLKQNPSSEHIPLDDFIKETDEAFKKLSPLEADHVFYRGRIRDEIAKSFNTDLDLIDASKTGDVITLDEAYPYFANDIRIARKFGRSVNGAKNNYLYEVLAPKGSKISCNMEHGGEAVFPRASKFEILSKEIKEDGSTFVKLKYILPES